MKLKSLKIKNRDSRSNQLQYSKWLTNIGIICGIGLILFLVNYFFKYVRIASDGMIHGYYTDDLASYYSYGNFSSVKDAIVFKGANKLRPVSNVVLYLIFTHPGTFNGNIDKIILLSNWLVSCLITFLFYRITTIAQNESNNDNDEFGQMGGVPGFCTTNSFTVMWNTLHNF